MGFVSYVCIKVKSVCFIALVGFTATLQFNSNILRSPPQELQCVNVCSEIISV